MICSLKMREDESIWFSKWEDQLPKPEELMPLTQTLIPPNLAIAFDIATSHNQPPPNPSELAADDPARSLKRHRLVWTPQLHKRFVDAVAYLGFRNAVPKTIMQIMNVDGLSRENVASHLQKYRLYLKSMQSLSSGGFPAAGDAATDRLFASSPVPPHFLNQSHPFSDNPLPIAAPQRQFVVRNSYVDDQESAKAKKALTLFPDC